MWCIHQDWKAGSFVVLAKSWADSYKMTPSMVHTEVLHLVSISFSLLLFDSSVFSQTTAVFLSFHAALDIRSRLLTNVSEFFSSQFSKPVFPSLFCGHRSQTSVTSYGWSIKGIQIQDRVKKKSLFRLVCFEWKYEHSYHEAWLSGTRLRAPQPSWQWWWNLKIFFTGSLSLKESTKLLSTGIIRAVLTNNIILVPVTPVELISVIAFDDRMNQSALKK